MVKVISNGQAAKHMKAIILKTRNMGMVNLCIEMVLHMKEIGSSELNMVKVLKTIREVGL